MYYLLVAAGDGGGIFDLYGDEGFWKLYFAAAFITFPIVLVLILIIQSINKGRVEETEDRRYLMDELAVKQYRKAAEQGDPEAQYALGVCYANGFGVKRDPARAGEWFGKAAENGAPGAQFELAERYYRGEGVPKDPKQAAEWYRKAAEQGLKEAQYNLGVCYYEGKGVPKDPKQAAEWFRKAAERDE